MRISTRATMALATAGLALTALSACSPANTPTALISVPAADAVTVQDAWIKSAESGMTAAFGVLHNSSEVDANVVGVSTDVSPIAELHETVEDASGAMVMRAIEGGFVIHAGGSFALEPAGNHLMLMGLTAPLTAGEEVTFTLAFSDGSERTFTAVVKDYSGANENYVGDADHMGHDDMDHTDHTGMGDE